MRGCNLSVKLSLFSSTATDHADLEVTACILRAWSKSIRRPEQGISL
jgi:hypothetical protein